MWPRAKRVGHGVSFAQRLLGIPNYPTGPQRGQSGGCYEPYPHRGPFGSGRFASFVKWLLLLLIPVASAYSPAEVGAIWNEQIGPGDAIMGHDVLDAGSQFTAWLELPAEYGVEEVHYQVCIVGDQCIISPRPATYDATVWRLDTADFRNPLDGKHHEWRAGDWIGIQWFLHRGDNVTAFPAGAAYDDTSCGDYLQCSDTHYFSFRVSDTVDTPLPFGFTILALVVARRLIAR